MTLTLGDLGRLLRLSLLDPAAAARAVLALRLPTGALWSGLGAVTCLGVLVAALAEGAVIELALGSGTVLVLSPFAYAVLLASSLVVTVFAVTWTGRMLGGQGDLEGALALVVWLEAVAIAVRLAQILTVLVLPPLALFVGLAGLFVLLWCLLNFTRELHGFDGLGRAAVTLILAVLGLGIGLSLILALIGVGATTSGA
ncbi:YIP1 family protein [Wenxinia marina]|uniref:Yip1 domain protein n=1 Tax=Wenxinia marina DSM 24838 TaxID=1123501 RepID=A0A0D0Q8S5_9RHOB|nr:YIP1 family protein [Wenxinia marina]KIQ68762.1 Yip1 domain protein [Wenxinia marina DSM 24838]GGL65344.1 hypothetical protein GCM10011392_20090 [Wenxinia marina]